eukprot:TRINITY_DN4294_c0_g1_i1.p1 TRINITY_DN4294_c0_g1~~TRINITY_DN4294_c0_g1_i1.p1  ORF type:complete len:467 (-),score=67.99 TRINITY_DN4294_c0_g1_i1:188-1483(-)
MDIVSEVNQRGMLSPAPRSFASYPNVEKPISYERIKVEEELTQYAVDQVQSEVPLIDFGMCEVKSEGLQEVPPSGDFSLLYPGVATSDLLHTPVSQFIATSPMGRQKRFLLDSGSVPTKRVCSDDSYEYEEAATILSEVDADPYIQPGDEPVVDGAWCGQLTTAPDPVVEGLEQALGPMSPSAASEESETSEVESDSSDDAEHDDTSDASECSEEDDDSEGCSESDDEPKKRSTKKRKGCAAVKIGGRRSSPARPSGSSRHTEAARVALENWWEEHFHYPRPTRTELNTLMRVTHLDRQQVYKWLDNKRTRWITKNGGSGRSAPFAGTLARGRPSRVQWPVVVDTRDVTSSDECLRIFYERMNNAFTGNPPLVIALVNDASTEAQKVLAGLDCANGIWPHPAGGKCIVMKAAALRDDWPVIANCPVFTQYL